MTSAVEGIAEGTARNQAAGDFVLCPGQGAQVVGMGKGWMAHPAAAEVFAEADRVLGLPLTQICLEGPEETLNRTDVAQAALFACGVASYRAMRVEGKTLLVGAAGLSLGEFTALHLAGAFDFASGLKLVRLRGQAMQDAAESTAGGMVALMGADEAQAKALCEAAVLGLPESQQVLAPANFNCPGQIVLSGTKAACEAAVAAAEKRGLKVKALVVAGAFHSPLMKRAAERLGAALEQIHWELPGVPVLSNVTGLPHEADIASIKRRLVEQVTSPVRWEQCMRWAIGQRRGSFLELEPAKVLGGLMRRIDPAVRVQKAQVAGV